VLLFAGFSAIACLYAGALWMRLPGSAALGALTVALGLGGVTASAYIYRVPSRPAWNTRFTLVRFNLTALTLGPLFAAAVVRSPAGVGDDVGAQLDCRYWFSSTVFTHEHEHDRVGIALRAFHGGFDTARWKPTLQAFAVMVAWFISDEWHQSFVPGRDASAWDVLADMIGFGIAAAAFFAWRVARERRAA
jgi:hypothetical protein